MRMNKLILAGVLVGTAFVGAPAIAQLDLGGLAKKAGDTASGAAKGKVEKEVNAKLLADCAAPRVMVPGEPAKTASESGDHATSAPAPPPAAGSNHRLGISQFALPPRFCPVVMLFPMGLPSASQYRFAACATRANFGATAASAANAVMRTKYRQAWNRRRSDRGFRCCSPSVAPNARTSA